jgi:hypothetical protein
LVFELNTYTKANHFWTKRIWLEQGSGRAGLAKGTAKVYTHRPGGAMAESQRHRVFVGRLAAPGADVGRVAEQLKRKPELVEALIAGVGSDTARVTFGASKVLRILSEQAPELLYPHFDFFVRLLEHENSVLKWNAALVLANLAAVDREGKLDQIMDAYLAPISGPNLIDAANVIRGAGAIARAKPQLANTISRRILQVERASYATRECRNVAIGHAIRALEQCFAAINDKRTVQLFVTRQMKNSRAATRRKAKQFLKKWPVERRHRPACRKGA